MKKLFIVIILLFAFSFAYADDRKGKPYNYGYEKRHGMVAITGNLTDRVDKSWGDLAPGGGAFIYYNVLNDFWGNFALGVSVDYIGGDFSTQNNIKGRADMVPLAFNVAYMTSSKTVNAWVGIGVSYNFATFKISDGAVNIPLPNNSNNNVSYSGYTQSNQLLGFDAFAGLEYLFTKDGRWGAFFEFRYTYSEMPTFSTGIDSDKLDMQQLKYTIGFSYHY